MNKQEKKVHEKVLLLGEFYGRVGREPKVEEEYNEVKIGAFLHNIRYKRIKLNNEDKKYLEGLGLRLTSRNLKERTHEKVLVLGKFYEEFGREPKKNEEYNGVKLGSFLHNIRSENNKISEQDKIFLEKLGVKLIKGIMQERKHEKVMLIGKFYEEFDREPKQRETYNGIKIGTFLGTIRWGTTKISVEDRLYLENLGIKL